MSSSPLHSLRPTLPSWTNPEFKERCEREGIDAVVPDFTWYEPLYLRGRGSGNGGLRTGGDPEYHAAETMVRGGRGLGCFPTLREVLGIDHAASPSDTVSAVASVLAAGNARTREDGAQARKESRPEGGGGSERADGGEGAGREREDDPETLGIFGRVGQPTAVEDLWFGPPLSAKVPPASDYERLLQLGDT